MNKGILQSYRKSKNIYIHTIDDKFNLLFLNFIEKDKIIYFNFHYEYFYLGGLVHGMGNMKVSIVK